MPRTPLAARLLAATLALAPAAVPFAAAPALAQTAGSGQAAQPGQAQQPASASGVSPAQTVAPGTSTQGKVVGTPQPAPDNRDRTHAYQSEAMLLWLGLVMLGAAGAVWFFMRRRRQRG